MADPDRLGTLMLQLQGVTLVAWLLGGATGPGAADLHGPRLRRSSSAWWTPPVRGFVYEAAGTVAPARWGRGRAWCARPRSAGACRA